MKLSITIIHSSAIRQLLTASVLLALTLGPALAASAAISIQACETQDTNGNGYIDALRFVTNAPLTDNFADLLLYVTVDGGVACMSVDTGPVANDTEFFVHTSPQSSDARLQVTVWAGSSLDLAAASVATVDKAKPALMKSWWANSVGGVTSANGYVFLEFSEPVNSQNAVISDFGLPVQNDTFGNQATVLNGQNQTNPNVVTVMLGANPVLTADGLYSPGSLAAGSPSGIFVMDGTRVTDWMGNVAFVPATSVAGDLTAGVPSPVPTVPVPEPATWLLAIMAALAGLLAWRRR